MRISQKNLMTIFFKKNKALIAITSVAMIVIAGMNLFASYLLQQLTDIAMGSDIKPLMDMIRYTIILIVIFASARLTQRYTYSRFVTKSIRDYKNYVFKEVTKKNIQSFQNENTSRYISALTNDATSIEEGYIRSVFRLIENSFTFFGAFMLMIWYSPILTMVAVILTTIPVIASIACANKMSYVEKLVSDQSEKFVGTVKDVLSGFSVVKSFKADDVVYQMFEYENQNLEHSKYRKYMTSELVAIIGGVASLIAQMGVFIAGAYLAITGSQVTPGTVIVFVQLMNFIVAPVGAVPTILGQRKAAKAIMKKIGDALNINAQKSGIVIDHKLENAIDFENVSYNYNEYTKAVEDLSFKLEVGKSYAFVGGSGSGKSTVLNLLMGSYSDYKGRILIDNKEIKEIQSDSLYNVFSIVQQNVFVFNNSIRDNITMFKQFDDEKVERAIKFSGLSDLLEKKGETFVCGENGSNLSGGEKQRISIARALLQETPVLLVDEATASLDKKTAFDVTNSILMVEGKTKVIVTHDLEEKLLKKFDEIIVMKNGRLFERGHFDQLIQKKEYFYSLFNVAN